MSKLIFFVDDDRMILNLLEYTISNKQDIDVKTFVSGEDCIKSLYLKPDLIVLDHYFKVNGTAAMDGLEILKIIRKKNKNIPVIILSALEDEKVTIDYKKYGANEYLPKNDYFVDNLLEVISQYTT